MDELLTGIDKVKEKLTSEEYKTLMESLGKVHKEQKKVTIEVFFASTHYETDHLDVYIKPQIRRIVLTQKSCDYVIHQHEGDFYRVHYNFFMNVLTCENRRIISNILYQDCRDDRYMNYGIPQADIMYDEKDFFYIRFLEGEMEEADIPDDSSYSDSLDSADDSSE